MRIGPVDDPLEREADRVADQVVRLSDPMISASTTPPQISRKCATCAEEEKLQRKEAEAPGTPARVSLRSAPRIMRLSPERFRRRLGRTDEQKKAIDALFENAEFMEYWNWLGACGGKGALGPIKLRVRRTWEDGVERFGVFKHDSRTLIVNPWKSEAVENPLELVDSVVHELLHAIHWAHVNGKCPDKKPPMEEIEYKRREEPEKKGKNNDKDMEPPDLTDVMRSDTEIDLLERQGPSASDPCGDFIDIRENPQLAINRIVSDVGERTGNEGSTRTRVNDILRNDIRKASERGAKHYSKFIAMAPVLAEFIRCRDQACFKERCPLGQPGIDCPRRPRRERDRNIEGCFQQVLEAERKASQRSAASPDAGAIQRMTADDAEAEELQRAAATADGGHCASRSQQAAERVVTSGGSPLPPRERAYFEPRFGQDFSGVRIHLGGEANDAAHGINALAFTLGRHVAFADGQFGFDTQQGRRLIAHELAHTLQQSGTGSNR
ncbi:MAG: DUF4157 domain-containing protein [Rhizobiales bacterium]|nr:DUF4157 domain-containing protein [Hyphomicrobiales bacterium]